MLASYGVVRERGCVIAGCCTGWCFGSFNQSAPLPDAVAHFCGVTNTGTRTSKPTSRAQRTCESRVRKWRLNEVLGGLPSNLSVWR